MLKRLPFTNAVRVIVSIFTFLPFSLLAQVQPRDLDGDPSTIEAYYEPSANITALANPNLAVSESFGITGEGIDRLGFMECATADSYIDALNASDFLGQSTWRLPSTSFKYSPLYGWIGGAHELDEVLGQRYSMHLPFQPAHDYRFLSGYVHPVNGRAYIKWGSTYGAGTEASAGLMRFVVWPVLDGDVGGNVSAAAAALLCEDSDGDGFGWNGVGTCTPANYTYFKDTVSPLEPRDLDGDVSSAEAYYHPQLDITWLADSRLPETERFNVEQILDNISPYANNEINADGSFGTRSAARFWLEQLNATSYSGYNEWRLPVASPTFESAFFNAQYDSEFDGLVDFVSQLAVGDGEDFELLTGDYFVQDSSNQWLRYAKISNYGGYGAIVDQTRYGDDYFVWPVHDGDIGLPIVEQANVDGVSLDPLNCVDNDGDGWGWDGTDSCRITDALPAVTACIDTDGDGCGWNGVESCIP